MLLISRRNSFRRSLDTATGKYWLRFTFICCLYCHRPTGFIDVDGSAPTVFPGSIGVREILDL